MPRLEKILVPIDFSENSMVAARHAGSLARHFHSELTLLHVNEFLVVHPMTGPLGFGITSTEAIRAEHIARRQRELEEFAAEELHGLDVKRIMRCGDPARLIVDYARIENSGLIVMPTRGLGAFRRFLLGSVTAKVLHDAECPVWTGTHLENAPATNPAELHRVMCAVDFGPQSIKALCWAAEFGQEFDVPLTAVHAVLETPPSLPDRFMFQWHAEAHAGAEERLHTLLMDLHIRADALVVGNGDEPKSLCAAAQARGAGLLVVGRSSSSKHGGRLGTHTYSIICHAPCPVVSV